MTTPTLPQRVKVRRRPFTVAEYDQMIRVGILTPSDRVELLEGEILAMPPIGDQHADCVDDLTRFFVRAVDDAVRVRIQNPVRLPPSSEPEPDVVLARPGRGHPNASEILLLIEVCDTSLARDRQLKLPLYARAGISEVWMVDLASRRIDVHRGPDPDGTYAQVSRHPSGDVLSPAALPGIRLPVDGLFSAR